MTPNDFTGHTPGPTWETFCDASYYHLWCVRRIDDRGFGQCYHVANAQEAEHLLELLNTAAPRLLAERDAMREQVARLREVLQYYSGIDRHEYADDNGRKARALLAEIGGVG